jgi:rhodanese-related sulfurtransferase
MAQSSRMLPLLTARDVAQELRQGTLILDARPAEQFAAHHIRGSVQISLMGNFSAWAALIIDPARKVLLVAENASSAQEAHNRLARVGLGQIVGYTLPDEAGWRREGIEVASISIRRCEQVRHGVQSDPSLQLIDVRSRAEWLKGHLPGAISMPLLDLDPRARPFNPSKPSLVYCYEGYRATTAASILLRESTGDIGILIDGVEGWSAAGLPLEVPDSKSIDSRTR